MLRYLFTMVTLRKLAHEVYRRCMRGWFERDSPHCAQRLRGHNLKEPSRDFPQGLGIDHCENAASYQLCFLCTDAKRNNNWIQLLFRLASVHKKHSW